MDIHTQIAIDRCPYCQGELLHQEDHVSCGSCDRRFSVDRGIPVLTDHCIHRTASLTVAEAGCLLADIDASGWKDGFASRLLSFPREKSEAVFAEFADERSVASALLLSRPNDQSVLCVGCSAGAVAAALARRFSCVTVCDKSLALLKLLRKRAMDENHDHMQFVCADVSEGLPFADSEFDFVMVDASVLNNNPEKVSEVLSKVTQVLAASGRCVLLGSNRREWAQRLRRQTTVTADFPSLGMSRLAKSAETAGLSCIDTWGITPNSISPAAMYRPSETETKQYTNPLRSLTSRLKDRLEFKSSRVPAFVIAANKPAAAAEKNFLETLLDETSDQLTATGELPVRLSLKRILARRSGRVVVLAEAEGESENRIVAIKLPFRPSAVLADQRNVDTLGLIGADDSLPHELRKVMPRHLLHGKLAGQPYFVEASPETSRSTESSRSTNGYSHNTTGKAQLSPTMRQLGQLLFSLHKSTARWENCERTAGERTTTTIRKSITSIGECISGHDQGDVLATIGQFLEAELVPADLPLVWSHGDPGIDNILTDRYGRVTGILDWESFVTDGFPLYDWVLICIGHYKRSSMGWGALRLAMDGHAREFFCGLALEDYLATFKIEQRLVPGLTLIAWARHVSRRIPNRGSDAKWVRRTIYPVLDFCRNAL